MMRRYQMLVFVWMLCATLVSFGLLMAQQTPRNPQNPQSDQPRTEYPRAGSQEKPATQPAEHRGHQMGAAAAASEFKGQFSATAKVAEKSPQDKTATVEVKVTGVKIVDPAKVGEQPKKGQGHFHYKLNDGPVIATTASKLSFHFLPAGQHKVVVQLAGNDHQPLGPEETLNINVP